MTSLSQYSPWYTNWRIWLLVVMVGMSIGVMFAYSYLSSLRQAISIQESLLTAESNTLLSNTSSVVSNLIRCERSDQQSYDALLSSIDTLTRAELVSLKQVYARCAYQQPSAMQAQLIQLNASFMAYQTLVELYTKSSLIDTRYQDTLQLWDAIIATETSRVQAMAKLHTVQEDIIDTLLAQEPTQAEQLNNLQAEAVTAQNDMRTLRLEVDSLRAQLE